MNELFEYKNLLVRYEPTNGTYHCIDALIGCPLGVFELEEGPGWVFIASGGLIMNELHALSEFQIELTQTLEG